MELKINDQENEINHCRLLINAKKRGGGKQVGEFGHFSGMYYLLKMRKQMEKLYSMQCWQKDGRYHVICCEE